MSKTSALIPLLNYIRVEGRARGLSNDVSNRINVNRRRRHRRRRFPQSNLPLDAPHILQSPLATFAHNAESSSIRR